MDLTKYCGDDPFRPYLNKPFSVGAFSYATNAHIMIRVPRHEDAPEQSKEGIDFEAPMKRLDEVTFSPLSHKELPPIPPPELVECGNCNGRGKEHRCPDCECTCDECNGSGSVTMQPKISTTIRGALFNLRYVAWVLELPNVELMTDTAAIDRPMLFKFDGGCGALMVMTSRYSEHVEIELDEAA